MLHRRTIGGGTKLAVTTTTGRTAALAHGKRYLVSSDEATALVHLRVGGSAVVATTSDFCLPAGAVLEIEPEPDLDQLAAITSSGTAGVFVAPLS